MEKFFISIFKDCTKFAPKGLVRFSLSGLTLIVSFFHLIFDCENGVLYFCVIGPFLAYKHRFFLRVFFTS